MLDTTFVSVVREVARLGRSAHIEPPPLGDKHMSQKVRRLLYLVTTNNARSSITIEEDAHPVMSSVKTLQPVCMSKVSHHRYLMGGSLPAATEPAEA